MKSTVLQEKLTKAQEKLAKKEALVKKYEAKCERIKAQIVAKGWSLEAGAFQKHNAEGSPTTEEAYECYWAFCDLASVEDDIKRTYRAIEEQKQIVENWSNKFESAKKQEEEIDREYPKELKELRTNLVKEWTAYDMNKKEFYTKKFEELGYKEFYEKYKNVGYSMMNSSEADFRKANEKTADALILNLWNRVKEKVGTVTEYNLYLDNGNSYEGMALNGTVKGTKGVAHVESILAGGYNIQRLHIRVLVK